MRNGGYMTEEGEKKTPRPGGKEFSKAAQITAALWIAALTILKAFGIVKLEIDEIIYSGISIAAIFIPVFP